MSEVCSEVGLWLQQCLGTSLIGCSGRVRGRGINWSKWRNCNYPVSQAQGCLHAGVHHLPSGRMKVRVWRVRVSIQHQTDTGCPEVHLWLRLAEKYLCLFSWAFKYRASDCTFAWWSALIMYRFISYILPQVCPAAWICKENMFYRVVPTAQRLMLWKVVVGCNQLIPCVCSHLLIQFKGMNPLSLNCNNSHCYIKKN